MIFAKGHGTQNDFVLLADFDAQLTLHPAAVAALVRSQAGPGRRRVLRVTTAGALAGGGDLDRLPDGVAADDWFMDYRNADGLIAEMCGNGVRVFAHYLCSSGLERRREFVVGSRGGPRPVVVHHAGDVTADVTVEMGKVNVPVPGGRWWAAPLRGDRCGCRQSAPGMSGSGSQRRGACGVGGRCAGRI